ncbi:MAG: hypothetical protein RLZZ216_1463 [Cyanobacteriota bacterium]|jgi:hypothetical protein
MMSGLSALLSQLNTGKYFPYKNATPRSSVSLGLLYDLGVIGSGAALGGGDTSALEAKIAALEQKVDGLQAELDTLTTELGLHENNGEHWTQEQIDARVDAYIKANSGSTP